MARPSKSPPKRRKDVLQYKAPECPKDDGSERRPFVVSDHAQIFDNEAVKRLAGQEVMLTEAQANFYGALGYIAVDITFKDERDEELDFLRGKLAELEAAKSGSGDREPSATETDADEDDEGTSSDSGGGKSGGGTGSGSAVSAERAAGRRKRQSTL